MKRARSVLIIILTSSALACATLWYVVRTDVTPETRTLRLATDALTLLPHTHEASDTILDSGHGIVVFSKPLTVEESLWITDMRVIVRNAPRSIIHHLHVERVLPEFADTPSAGSFLTAGQDTEDQFGFPAPAGIFLSAGTDIQIEVMMHNPIPPLGEGGVYKDVVFEVELTGVPEGGNRFLPVFFNLIVLADEQADTKEATFTVPPQTENFVRTSAMNPPHARGYYVFPNNGWIVHMGAHLHAWEGGESIQVFRNNELLRTYTSFLENRSVPWSWRTNVGPFFTRVQRGDVISIEATYDNLSDVPRTGAMGMLGFYYIQDSTIRKQQGYELSWYVKSVFYPLFDTLGIHLTS